MERNNHTITINKISDEAKVALRVRVISAIIGLLIIIPCIILGDWLFFVLIGFITAIAGYEIVACAKKKYSIWLYICTMLACLLICYWPLLRTLISQGVIGSGHIYSYFDSMYVSILVMVVGLFALFYIIMWDENFTVRDACFIFSISMLVAIGFQALSFLRFFPAILLGEQPGEGFYNPTNTFTSMILLMYFLIAVFFTDIGAYFTGMLFGKKKINPRISPKKTWAGFFGGLIISTVISAGFALILAATGYPIIPVHNGFSIFDLNHWYNIVILSALIPPFATLGDFVFSAVKRYYGIKDFGNIMPGHGGILDRADSVLFGACIATIFIVIVWAMCYGGVNPLL